LEVEGLSCVQEFDNALFSFEIHFRIDFKALLERDAHFLQESVEALERDDLVSEFFGYLKIKEARLQSQI
jgi:hypothetical protein